MRTPTDQPRTQEALEHHEHQREDRIDLLTRHGRDLTERDPCEDREHDREPDPHWPHSSGLRERGTEPAGSSKTEIRIRSGIDFLRSLEPDVGEHSTVGPSRDAVAYLWRGRLCSSSWCHS